MEKTCCNEEKGISETLTATGQSGLTATRLLGRSGASSQVLGKLGLVVGRPEHYDASYRERRREAISPNGNRATGRR